jgi:hypothetical protein
LLQFGAKDELLEKGVGGEPAAEQVAPLGADR